MPFQEIRMLRLNRPEFEPPSRFVLSQMTCPPFYWFSPEFSALVRRAEVEPAREISLSFTVLAEVVSDRRLMKELATLGFGLPLKLGAIWALLHRAGPGCAFDSEGSNIFPVTLPDGTVGTGNAWYSQGKGWCIGVSAVSDTHMWVKGSRVASHGIC